MAAFRRIRRTGKLHLQWYVVKTHADAICTGPRSKEEIKSREEKETEEQKETAELLPYPPHRHFRTHTPPTIHTRSLYISV